MHNYCVTYCLSVYYKTYCFAFQKRRFCIAKQPLSQRQIEIIVFLTNYLYKTKAILGYLP